MYITFCIMSRGSGCTVIITFHNTQYTIQLYCDVCYDGMMGYCHNTAIVGSVDPKRKNVVPNMKKAFEKWAVPPYADRVQHMFSYRWNI